VEPHVTGAANAALIGSAQPPHHGTAQEHQNDDWQDGPAGAMSSWTPAHGHCCALAGHGPLRARAERGAPVAACAYGPAPWQAAHMSDDLVLTVDAAFD